LRNQLPFTRQTQLCFRARNFYASPRENSELDSPNVSDRQVGPVNFLPKTGEDSVRQDIIVIALDPAWTAN
jgi:hypothetical protein